MVPTRLAKLFLHFAVFIGLACSLAQAQKLTTLHSFNDTDGSYPYAGLIQGADGNFYGTTPSGANNNGGTVFKITPSGTLTTIYGSFSPNNGETPYGGLLQANDGNFYGTAYFGGASNNCNNGCGVVYQVTPQGGYKILHSFTRGTDGGASYAALIQAKDGYLYGTTLIGGGAKDGGIIFKISLDGSTYNILYSFCQQNNCTDGKSPHASLVQGSDGNFYGTTEFGGTSIQCFSGCGTVFKITPAGVLTTLHTFNATDGEYPVGSLVQGNDGNFYGTANGGGADGEGTVFKISPDGVTFNTLHSFCSQGACLDGTSPYAGLVQGNDGNFYGTTHDGGANGKGTIFSVTPTGLFAALYTFSGTSDGGSSTAALVQGSDGNFYGTAGSGGAHSQGTVFSFSSGGMQFIPLTPCRVVDTRNSNGPFGGPYIQGKSSRDFPLPLSPSCNIPSTAIAYSLNATVIPRGPLGFITVWPTGLVRPLASTLNSYDGRVKANALVMPAGAGGGVSVYASDPTDVVLDINGYFELPSMSTLAFYPVAPCRVADTRNPNGPLGGPFIPAKTPRDFPILSSTCGLPMGALAYSMNFTAVPHGPLGYLTVWASDQQQPYVSTLNAYTGGATANAAIVPAAKDGDIDAYVSDDSDLVIDVNGYFAPAGMNGLSLYPFVPCRALDTRPNSFKGPLMVPVKNSPCAVPSKAEAYIFNATVIPQGPLGFLTLWADTKQQPGVSTLNAYDGITASNMAIVPTVNGMIDAFASDSTNLVLDITSYFAP